MGVVKRILKTWNSKLSGSEQRIIDTYLDEPGKFLFYQMSRIDQHHALDVAQTILSEAGFTRGLDLNTLVTAALLHDIGKVEGDFSFISRIITGLIRRLWPTGRGKLALTQPRSFFEKVRYGFYVDLVHPARGSHMAKIFGVPAEVVELIRHHHDPPREGQNSELTWLQLADSRN